MEWPPRASRWLLTAALPPVSMLSPPVAFHVSVPTMWLGCGHLNGSTGYTYVYTALSFCLVLSIVTLWVSVSKFVMHMRHTRSQWLRLCDVLSIVEKCIPWIGTMTLSSRVLSPKCCPSLQNDVSNLRSKNL